MTRIDELYAMRMKDLVVIAEKLGIKINKKGKNSAAAEKIYAEEQRREVEARKEKESKDQEKQESKKERKPRQKKENPARDKVIMDLDAIYKEAGYIKSTYEKVGPNFVVLRKEEKGRVKFEFYYGQKDLKINMKPVVAEKLNLDHVLINNYYLPAVVRIAYTGSEAMYNTINAILSTD